MKPKESYPRSFNRKQPVIRTSKNISKNKEKMGLIQKISHESLLFKTLKNE